MSFIINPYIFGDVFIHTTFDGSNESISVPDSASLDLERTQAFSFSAWVYLTNLTNNFPIVTKRGAAAVGYHSRINATTGKILLSLVNNSVNNRVIVNSSTGLSAGSWNHVAITKSTSSLASGINFYLNGSLLGKDAATSDNLTASILNNEALQIGLDAGSSQYANGKIDKVIMYSKELSAGEVTTIYNYGRKKGLIGVGSEISQWELDTLNPIDEIGTNDGTSVNMDSSNIVIG